MAQTLSSVLVRQDAAYARGGGRAGGVVRDSGDARKTATKSIEGDAGPLAIVIRTRGSRGSSGARNDDAGTASLRSIEQLFSQPVCFRSGQAPDDSQQHAARAEDDIIAIDGSNSTATSNAVESLRTIADCSLEGEAEGYSSQILQKLKTTG